MAGNRYTVRMQFGPSTRPIPTSSLPPPCNGCGKSAKTPHATSAPPIQAGSPPTKPIKWAYGVTTIPERKDNLLPKTLTSLSAGGFDAPRLFVDGCNPGMSCWYEKAFTDAPVTPRWPRVNAYANWYLSLHELFMRDPGADRYAIFQDDILVCRNLRPYLDHLPFPQRGYLNLTTFWENEAIVGPAHPIGIVPAMYRLDWAGKPKKPNSYGVSPQHGRGAMGLVFNRDGVLALLRHPHMTDRILPEGRDPNRYFRYIDGAVVEALNASGFIEYIHNPGLLQHNGPQSAISKKVWGPKSLTRTFPGESFDCLSLLSSPEPVPAQNP